MLELAMTPLLSDLYSAVLGQPPDHVTNLHDHPWCVVKILVTSIVPETNTRSKLNKSILALPIRVAAR